MRILKKAAELGLSPRIEEGGRRVYEHVTLTPGITHPKDPAKVEDSGFGFGIERLGQKWKDKIDHCLVLKI